MIKLIKTSSSQEAIDYLADSINSQLASGEKVLWLVSGGSSVPIAVAVANLIDKTKLQNLTVSQVDERFGPPGHKDSNWQQLLNARFPTQGMRLLPILKGKDIQQTKDDFEAELGKELSSGEFRAGIFGIGADGHTAGILPGSPAIESQQLTSIYQGPDFQRITITAKTISMLELVVGYASGPAKAPALLKLQQENLSVREQPAQALKLAKRAVIFNDQVGDSL